MERMMAESSEARACWTNGLSDIQKPAAVTNKRERVSAHRARWNVDCT